MVDWTDGGDWYMVNRADGCDWHVVDGSWSCYRNIYVINATCSGDNFNHAWCHNWYLFLWGKVRVLGHVDRLQLWWWFWFIGWSAQGVIIYWGLFQPIWRRCRKKD